HALGHLAADLDGGIALIDKALLINPNLAAAWFLGGFLRLLNGDPDDATAYFERAMRLSPLDPEMYRMQAGKARGRPVARRLNSAPSLARTLISRRPTVPMPGGVLARR